MIRAVIIILLLSVTTAYSNAKECMTEAIYHEGKNQSFLGQIAIAQVIMNRVYSKHFPSSVCDVVHQAQTYKNGKIILHRCQFSYYCDGKPETVDPSNQQWIKAMEYASIILEGRIRYDLTEGAEFYHAYYVRPSWMQEKTRTVRIDSHIFYKWKFK